MTAPSLIFRERLANTKHKDSTHHLTVPHTDTNGSDMTLAYLSVKSYLDRNLLQYKDSKYRY